ncbi:hypothetical protein ACFY1P_19930 [Streptomyces sp. NPDC001407]|uniref:hypothetical protein n=1 Tax=Streptomyces sp. NPDC001407 TaxID=3364573 RepID=UPI003694EBA1
MPLAVWALIRPRKRGWRYGKTRIQEWNDLRAFNLRTRELRSQPRPPRLAVEITGEDVKAVESLVRAADAAWNRNRPDAYMDHEAFIARLYERIGAASVTGAPALAVPLFEDEIVDLDGHLTTMVQQHAPQQDLAAARQLLSRLHALKGRARAMQTLNGIPVAHPAIES